MDIIKAVILGAIEGVTEFLPISSTAHLLVGQKLLSFRDEAELFTVVIQLGAILAAVWFFRKDLASLAHGIKRRDKSANALLRNICIGIVPAGIIGLVVQLTVGLPNSLTLIAISLIVGGIALWLVENKVEPRGENVEYGSITARRSLVIGLAQCLAIVPGVSRSGATIASGLLTGLNRPTATAFSFYLSVPIMMAASGLKLATDMDQIDMISGGATSILVGSVASFVTAFIVVGWLLRYVQKHDFKPFAYYRILAGILILVFLV